MANTKLWLGQWECVLQERDPAPSTTPCCNLLPHKGHSSQEQRRISSETLAHFRFGGSFLQVQLQRSHLVAGEEQWSFSLLSGPSAQNLKALLQTHIPPSKQNLTLHGFLACWKKQLLLQFSVSGKLVHHKKFKCSPHMGESRAEARQSLVPSPHIPFSSENPRGLRR